MILGTVELGLTYGINNVHGKPDKEEAFLILKTAYENGVNELDTASSYGDSEQIIGEFQNLYGTKFKIDTKLTPKKDLLQKDLFSEFQKSQERLCTENINVLYLHSFEQCKEKMIMTQLFELKSQGKIKYIGISIYDPSELEYILENLPDVDVVQIPLSILTLYRWRKNNLLFRASKKLEKLYVRSIYSQGLIFKDINDEFIIKIKAEKYISILRQLATNEKISIQELAFAFVNSLTEIDKNIIIGCEKLYQLQENIRLANRDLILSPQKIDAIESEMKDIPDEIIDPRKWS